METILISAIISVTVSFITACSTTYVTFYFRDKEDRKKFILNENYQVYKKLFEKLKEFFSNPDISDDPMGYRRKQTIKDINKRLSVNFEEYKKKVEIGKLEIGKKVHFCEYDSMESSLHYIKKFEELFLKDIKKISLLSPTKIKKISTKIENIYTDAKEREKLLEESLGEELGDVTFFDDKKHIHFNDEGYYDFKKEAYWGKCWLEILPLLKKLKKYLKNAVNRKGIEK